MEWIAIWAVALAVLVLSRSILLLRYRWAGSDSFYLLVSSDLIRSQGTLDVVNERFVVPEKFDYPPLLPVLLSRIPIKWSRQAQWGGPISDICCSFLVAGGTYALLGWQTSVVAFLVYASTPAAFNDSYMLSARSVGNLFLTITMLALLASSLGEWYLGWLVAGFFGGLVFLSHRLTAQSLMACVLGASLFDVSLVVGMLLVSAATALLLTRGWYLRSVRGHLRFLVDLAKTGQVRVRPIYGLRAVIGRNPHLLALFMLIAVPPMGITKVELWLLASIMMLLTLSIAWPLGEGDRHFGNASGLVAIAVASLSVGKQEFVPIAVTIVVSCAILGAKMIRYPRLASQGVATVVSKAVLDACAVLRATPTASRGELVVLSWPLSLSYQIMFLSGGTIVSASGGTGAGLLYNYDLIERVRSGGLGALEPDELPTHILHNLATPLQMDKADWNQIHSSDEVVLYESALLKEREHNSMGAKDDVNSD